MSLFNSMQITKDRKERNLLKWRNTTTANCSNMLWKLGRYEYHVCFDTVYSLSTNIAVIYQCIVYCLYTKLTAHCFYIHACSRTICRINRLTVMWSAVTRSISNNWSGILMLHLLYIFFCSVYLKKCNCILFYLYFCRRMFCLWRINVSQLMEEREKENRAKCFSQKHLLFQVLISSKLVI